ncbi:ATP-binding protein [Streptomyces sp. NEAU-S77]|uniref:ATP-binding protein n=1 Tax=Streptomyces sp. NEAU-S77 TaxID=3411033 RepID=UPI003BA1515C
MHYLDDPSGGSLAQRLDAARNRAFVGRAGELALFRSALDGEPGSFAVLYLHGLGGVGKSTLLRRFGEDTRAAGRMVVEVSGRTIDPSPAGFEAAAAQVFSSDGAVLLVDDFEHCQALEGWLRESFLPRLPARALTVIAGRQEPASTWETDPGWADVVRVVRLGDLPPEDAVALLESRGVAHAPLLAFASGHPLALSLAAEVALQDPAAAVGELPTQDVCARLLAHLVGELPSLAHRHALEVCCHARTTTEELLRAAMPEEDAGSLFTWLRRLPFVESGPQGVYPHDVIRQALNADLRWRDPQGFTVMHSRIRDHLIERAAMADSAHVIAAMRPIMYVHGARGPLNDVITWQAEEEFREEEFREEDRPVLLRLAAQAEGSQSAALVDFWLDRQPEAFWVHRRSDTGELVGFMAWLHLSDPSEEELRADPVAGAAWTHSRAAGPLRPGEHLGIARFMVYPAAYQRPSAVMDLTLLRIMAEVLLPRRAAWSFIVFADPDLWAPAMAYGAHHRMATDAAVGGRSYALFGHDWRAVPMERLLARASIVDASHPTAQSPVPARELAVLSRPDFDAALRDALRCWHRPDTLSSNPLSRSRLVADTGTSLRDVLKGAIDTLDSDPRSTKAHRALTMTFINGAPTQEAAARRLGLPFSTYRRHLTLGIQQVSDLLWRQELHGATPR